ncbi:hypothetical protein DNU06_15660 [Putridiphycobacter roseus]|uniref:Uncharacterized protein n=1 Tax=Putridiphycobacter roseus TaxID=2219161 RepID=A0A2W1NJZ0_9FLAO|nr:hypothetical protein [Putridiphycobacter roseus]PZE15942.1 hypothetical protein DNU06_15660 [Putridiphycobacter roseus]
MFWTAGFGVGVLHVFWDEINKFGPTVNASLTLNFRISKRIYIETAPLFVILPINRIYYSPIKTNDINHFYAVSAIPIGLKVKL